jgi:hypothetical protein
MTAPRDANHQFRNRSSAQDVQWALLAFFLFVLVDVVVARWELV